MLTCSLHPAIKLGLAVGIFQGCSWVGTRENGVPTPFCTYYNKTWLRSLHRCASDMQFALLV